MCYLFRLQDHAARFRGAIESCDKSDLPPTFMDFPRGSCGDASLLLAKFLEESGFGLFNYFLGEQNENSHAWLENGDVVVDITADQFPDMPDSVVVARNSKWHLAFCGEFQHVANFDNYDKNTRLTLLSAYFTILKHVEYQDESYF